MSVNEYQRIWDTGAADYRRFQEPVRLPAFDSVVRRLGLHRRLRFLDVGCGPGTVLALAAAAEATVIGVDLSAAMLHAAKRRVPSALLYQADMECLPFANASFDVVTSFGGVHVCDEPAAALAEIQRATRPGGRVAVLGCLHSGRQWEEVMQVASRFSPPSAPASHVERPLTQPGAVEALMARVGLRATSALDITVVQSYPDSASAVRALQSLAVFRRAAEYAGEGQLTRALLKLLATMTHADGTVRVQAVHRCVFARRPRARPAAQRLALTS